MKNRINTEQTNIIGFTDLAMASYLALTFPIIELIQKEGNRFEFIFADSQELQQAVENFYSNQAIVSPIEYFNSLKNLKGRLYSRR